MQRTEDSLRATATQLAKGAKDADEHVKATGALVRRDLDQLHTELARRMRQTHEPDALVRVGDRFYC